MRVCAMQAAARNFWRCSASRATAQHGRTAAKISLTPAEVKAKLKAATEETKSLAVIKVERYTADAWMNSSKTMQKSK